jgi:hypothetical protein
MVFHHRRKHNMKKYYLVPSVLMVLLIGLAGCGNPAGGDKPSVPQSIVYKSTAEGKVYELTVTETIETNGKAVYAAKTGDTYVLKITDASGTEISTGTVEIANVSGELTLQPSWSGAGTFTITISSGDSMTAITGTITLDNGDSEPPPGGTVTPLPPDSNALPAPFNLAAATAIQVYNPNGTEYTESSLTFTHHVRDPDKLLSSYGMGNLVVTTSGILDLSVLGDPTTELDSISDWQNKGFTVNAPAGTKFWTHLFNGGFSTADSQITPYPRLDWEGASLFFATNDATITGNVTGFAVSIILKQGWNTVIVNETARTIVSGIPDDNCRWTIRASD